MTNVIFAVSAFVVGMGFGAQAYLKSARAKMEVELEKEVSAFKKGYKLLRTRVEAREERKEEVEVREEVTVSEQDVEKETQTYSAPKDIEVVTSADEVDDTFEIAELIYYKVDAVLANTLDEMVEDVEYLVGDSLANVIPGDLITVLNRNVGCVYEISVVDVSFAETVLGYPSDYGDETRG